MHPRNQHKEKYNFPELIQAVPELGAFVKMNAYGRITYKMEKSSSTGKSTPVGVSYSFSSVEGCESGVFSGYGANSGIPMEVNRQVNGKMYKYRIDLPCQAAYFNP